MSSKGKRITMKNGLTPNENRFKDKIIEQVVKKGDVNLTQAAMEVYDIKNRTVASKVASEVAGKPDVRRSLEDALSASGLTPDLILDEMKVLAVSRPEKITGETKLKTLIELLKLTGNYPGKNTHKSATIKLEKNDLGFMEAKEIILKTSTEGQDFITDSE